MINDARQHWQSSPMCRHSPIEASLARLGAGWAEVTGCSGSLGKGVSDSRQGETSQALRRAASVMRSCRCSCWCYDDDGCARLSDYGASGTDYRPPPPLLHTRDHDETLFLVSPLILRPTSG